MPGCSTGVLDCTGLEPVVYWNVLVCTEMYWPLGAGSDPVSATTTVNYRAFEILNEDGVLPRIRKIFCGVS